MATETAEKIEKKPATATAEKKAAPPTVAAMCDCTGCGAPAIATTSGDPSIDHFDEFDKPEDAHKDYGYDPKSAAAGRRMLPRHDVAHGPLNHCWGHRMWIGTQHARIVAATKGV